MTSSTAGANTSPVDERDTSPPAPSDETRFVITGAPCSATGYAAQVLTAAGVPCGHEEIVGQHRTPSRWLPPPAGPRGESSWLAAPLLWALPVATVVHLVRHPLNWVVSLEGALHGRRRGFHEQYLAAHGCILSSADSETLPWVHSALHLWLRWNRLIEHQAALLCATYRRIRIERLSSANCLRKLARVVDADPGRVAEAATTVPTSYNTHRRLGIEAPRWEHIQDGHLVTQLRTALVYYGYTDGLPS